MTTKLIWITPEAEKHIAYCARVSSDIQENPEYEKLFRYLIKHNHWSPFEMASMCVEIETTRMISQQLLRHRSFSFQEFSQRYSDRIRIDFVEPRLQGAGRQGGEVPASSAAHEWWREQQVWLHEHTLRVYAEALAQDIAKECARAILPMITSTRLYMSGTIRSWIHYVNVRTEAHTQKEHRMLAKEIGEVLVEQCPVIGKMLENL